MGGANQTEEHNVKISIQGRVTGIPLTNIPGLYIAISRIYLLLCSYGMYCVLRYISQPHPSQHPQSHGSSLKPRDGHRTIPSNGESPS